MLVTNAYICYCKVCDEHDIPKKNRRSHLEFRKDLALAWIDMEHFNRYLQNNNLLGRKRKAPDEVVCSPITLDTDLQSTTTISYRTRSGNEVTAVAKRIRCTAITDTSLDPGTSSLRRRLSRTGIDHMHDKPITGKDATRCQLHRWLGFEYCKHVSFCCECYVHICVSCYRLFHNEPDIVGRKIELQRTLNTKTKPFNK